MKLKDNGVESNDLVVMLHGASSGIDSILFKTIFNKLKDSSKKVVAFEFSFVETKTQPDPDQIVESKELEEYLKTQKYNNLTVIGHSNGGFVGLVATTRRLNINHLIILGLSHITKEGTKQAIAKIIQDITNQGNKVTIIQPIDDPYSTPEEINNFVKEFSLNTDVKAVAGNHYFEGYEERLAEELFESIKI